MKCPNCRKLLTLDHIRESPECDKYLARLNALRVGAKRTTVTRAGGRPKGSSNKTSPELMKALAILMPGVTAK